MAHGRYLIFNINRFLILERTNIKVLGNLTVRSQLYKEGVILPSKFPGGTIHRRNKYKQQTKNVYSFQKILISLVISVVS